MRILELFSGTHSVGKVAEELGYEVVSLDLKGADINTNILEWDYKSKYPVGHFDIIHASPPCDKFSAARRSNIGRPLKCFNGEIATREMMDKDMLENGLPILRKTESIIDYFQPKFYIIENPQTGKMKDFLQHRPHFDTDYCQWGFDYRKRTRFWTNIPGVETKQCDRNTCPAIIRTENGKCRHKQEIAGKTSLTLKEKYRIPPLLVKYLFDKIKDAMLEEL